MEGFSFPSLLKRGTLSILAKGLLGLGSQGVPSNLVHAPTVEFQPTTLRVHHVTQSEEIRELVI